MKTFFLIFCFSLMAAMPVRAATVVELFTSQGCSSCPPADKVFAGLAKQDGVIALSCHVTYWDKLGWKDTMGQEFCTDRQYDYADSFGKRNVYTPQMVINGRDEGVGSNIFSVYGMMGRAGKNPLTDISASLMDSMVKLSLPDMPAPQPLRIVLIGFQASRTETIGRGENGGKNVTYVNVVTTLENIGRWDGTAMDIEHKIMHQAENYVILLQQEGGALRGVSTILKP